MRFKIALLLAIIGLSSIQLEGQIRREYWTDISAQTDLSEETDITFELSTRANSETQDIHQFLARSTAVYRLTRSIKAIGGLAYAQTSLNLPSDFLLEARPFIGIEYAYTKLTWIELSVLARNEFRLNFLRAGGDFQEVHANRFRVRPGLKLRPFSSSRLEGLVLFADAEYLFNQEYGFPAPFETSRYRLGLQYPINEKWVLEGSYFKERGISVTSRMYRDVYRLGVKYWF